MTTEQQREIISKQPLLTIEIIVASMVMGCVLFLVIALFLNPPTNLQIAWPPGLLTYVLFGFTLMALVARAVVPAAVVSAGVRRLAESRSEESAPGVEITGICDLLQTRTIIAAAMLEFVAFFAMLTYILEKSPLALLLAILLIFALAMHIPTRAWAERWIEARLDSLEEDRQFDR